MRTDGELAQVTGLIRRTTVWFIVAGVAVGVVFPPFASLFVTFKPGMLVGFVVLCIAAGMSVGGFGAVAVRRTVVRRLLEHADAARERERSLGRVLTAIEVALPPLQQAVQDLSRSHSGQNEAISRQVAAIQQVSVTTNEINQTSRLASEKAAVVLERVEKADRIMRDGEQALSSTVGVLGDMASGAGEISQTIALVAERTRQIEEVTATVKEFAEQSNMLALNAALEATRAGEAGRGFRLVANEMRRLADASIKGSGRVRMLLDELGGAVREAVAITGAGAARVERGLTQLQGSTESLRELGALVGENFGAVRQIASAVRQQNEGVSQILGAMGDLNAIAGSTEDALEGTARALAAVEAVVRDVTAVAVAGRAV